MQAKRPIAKLVKLPSKFPSWKLLKGSEIGSHYSEKNSEMFQEKQMQKIKK